MLGLLTLLSCAVVYAQDVRTSELGPVQIIGSSIEDLIAPLAPARVQKQKLETYQFTDVTRALRSASGVYVREEDGQGLRPNIGLRGTNPDRSKKVVLMEDGILIGPAPYAAPAAYFTPSMLHVESLEVFKGFSATTYGPNSIGGAVNYLTPSIPLDQRHELQAQFGSFATSQLKARTGGPMGPHGYLFELSRLTTEGFKRLDGGGPTGFAQTGFLGKLDFKLAAQQTLGLKVGYNDELSHETYLGLSATDFQSSPYRRYASSALDEMRWRHTDIRVRHNWQINEHLALENTIYRHDLDRTWYRLDRFRNSAIRLRSVMADPTGANLNYFNIIQGSADSSTLGTDGQLVMANNERLYFSQGLQSKLFGDSGPHKWELSLRVHQDQIRRNHTYDLWSMTAGRLTTTGIARQLDVMNRESATAFTFSATDNWSLGAWTLTPVLRYENVRFGFQNLVTNQNAPRADRFWVPGLAVTRALSSTWSAKLSANSAATVAGLNAQGLERREESLNYEFELRHRDPERSQELSFTAFVNDYRNLTGTCTGSSGCSSTQLDVQFNGGRARVAGLELAAAKGYQLGIVYIPLQAQATLLQAQFMSNFTSDSPDWGIGEVRKGDPLPYIPRTQFNISAGTEVRRFKQDVSLVYQSKVYDQSSSVLRQEVPSFTVVDWAGSYSLSKNSRLTFKADNVLGRNYAVAARPFGFRPGKPQAFQVGWTYTF